MDILDLLRADGSIVVNKKLARKIGLDQAIIYSELVSMYKFYKAQNKLIDGEWFYCTIESLEANTTLKKDKQNRAINELVKLGLIETKRMGLPARRYFRITNGILDLIEIKFSQNAKSDNDKGLDDEDEEKESENPHEIQFSQNKKTGFSKMRKQDLSKCSTNNTNIINTKLINTNKNNDLSIQEEEKEGKKENNQENDRLIELELMIQKKDLPMRIKQVLKHNVQRIHKDNISLDSIEMIYYANESLLNVHQFALVLNNVLRYTKNKIENIDFVLQKAIENYLLDINDLKKSQKEDDKKEDKTKGLPKWMTGEYKPPKKQELTEEEMQKKIEEVKEALAKFH